MDDELSITNCSERMEFNRENYNANKAYILYACMQDISDKCHVLDKVMFNNNIFMPLNPENSFL